MQFAVEVTMVEFDSTDLDPAAEPTKVLDLGWYEFEADSVDLISLESIKLVRIPDVTGRERSQYFVYQLFQQREDGMYESVRIL